MVKSRRSDIICHELSLFLEEYCGIIPNTFKVDEIAYLELNEQQIIKVNLCENGAGSHNRDEQINYSSKKINLYHLWEDLWYTKREVIKSRIRSILGKTIRIYGRETNVRRIDNDLLLEFLAQNHSSVPLKAKYKYGLFHKDVLVAVASFAAPRKLNSKSGAIRSYELLRYANINHHTVVGGLSKLVTAFVKDKKPDDIMTYLDNDWTSGRGFYKLHFKKTGELAPFKLYIDTHYWQRIHPGNIYDYTGFDPEADREKKFERLMKEKDIVSIYNSGSTKLNLTITTDKSY